MPVKNNLKKTLETIYTTYHTPSLLTLDPLSIVRRYRTTPSVAELIGFIASAVSYGRVEQICITIERIIAAIERVGDPLSFATQTSLAEKQKSLAAIKHRFNTGDDIAHLIHGLGKIITEKGSLESLFAQNMTPERSYQTALALSVEEIRRRSIEGSKTLSPSFHYLLAAPMGGSACKRLQMFLRWMVRADDGIDLGIWLSLKPAVLLIPLDVHTMRIAQSLALTAQKTANWRTAEEVTAKLREFSPADPVKYDFSLCHSGMVFHRESI